jgi:RimJ/RimL family protein N-acetyltransferase
MSELFPARLQTDRLELEALTDETIDPLTLYRIASRHEPAIDEITRYLNWAPHETPKDSLEFIEMVTAERESGDGAAYLIRPRDGEDGAGELAGCAGLDVDWERRRGTLGTWLRKRFWGRGYSGERAAALFELAFERLDLEVVGVTCHEDNEKSRRAIEKYVEAHGGTYEGLIRNELVRDGDGPADVHRYSVTREEYGAATGGE